MHLAQHHQHIEIGLNGNRVTGFSTFPTLTAFGELALFRMVQMLSAGLRRCH